MELVHGDILEYSGVGLHDVVYMCCLTWGDALLERVANSLQALKRGARVIALRRLDIPGTKLAAQGRFEMSWGISVAYVYERL